MVPSSPNSPRNTSHNLAVLDKILPLGQMVTTPKDSKETPSLCSRDQNFDEEKSFAHYARDFPMDDGTGTSFPEPPILDWWSASDVWNYDLPPVFDIKLKQYLDPNPPPPPNPPIPL